MQQQTLKNNFKAFLLRIAPGLAEQLRTAWQKRHARRFESRLGLPSLAREFTARHGFTIFSGPFAGMAYVARAVGSAVVPKLVGSYEQELHGVLADIAQTPYMVVVDVGCAEGYYAVGLAARAGVCFRSGSGSAAAMRGHRGCQRRVGADAYRGQVRSDNFELPFERARACGFGL